MKQILLALVLAAAAVTGVAAADTIGPAVPADALAYVYLDVPAYLDGLDHYAGLMQIVAEGSSVRKFLAPVLAELEKACAEADAEHKLDFKIEESLPCLNTGYGLIVSGAYTRVENIPAGMLVLQAGGNAEKIGHIVDVLIERLAATQAKAIIDTVPVDGAKFHRVVFHPVATDAAVPDWIEGDEARAQYAADALKEQEKAAARLNDNPLVIGVHKGFLTVTNCPAMAEAFFVNCGAKEPAGLAAQADYQAVMARVNGAGAPMKLYVNTACLVDWLKKMPPDMLDAPSEADLQRVVTAIHSYGFSDLAAVGLALSFQADRLDEAIYLAWPAGDRGILKAMLKDRGTPDVPAVIHPDAVALGAWKGDLKEIYLAVIKLITEIEPGFPEQFAKNQEQMQQALGFGVEALIGSFTGSVAFYTCPPEPVAAPAPAAVGAAGDETEEPEPKTNVVAIMLDMTDATVMPKLLETMLSQMGPFVAPEEFMGEKLYVVGMPTGGAQPAFGLINKRLVIVFDAEELRNQVRRAASESHKLSDTVRDGISQLKTMPPAGSIMSMYRARGNESQLAKLYDTLMKQLVDEVNSELDLELKAEDIPPFKEFEGLLNIDSFIKGGMVEGGYLINSQSFNRNTREETKKP
ncbi:MAG: hypothetical protein ABIF71_02650 [Planctomycetota bacterium]